LQKNNAPLDLEAHDRADVQALRRVARAHPRQALAALITLAVAAAASTSTSAAAAAVAPSSQRPELAPHGVGGDRRVEDAEHQEPQVVGPDPDDAADEARAARGAEERHVGLHDDVQVREVRVQLGLCVGFVFCVVVVCVWQV
jgi:hypothetical protein